MEPPEWADRLYKATLGLLEADTITDMQIARAIAWRLVEQYEYEEVIQREQ
jgi:hypothetical protein